MRRTGNKQGVAIIVVLLVLTVMAVIAAGVVALGTGSLGLANAQAQGERAYYAAEAGLAITLNRLQADVNHAGSSEFLLVGASPSRDSFDTKVFRQGDAGFPAGVVGSEYRYILSEGRAQNDGFEIRATRRVGLLARVTQSMFSYAVFARNAVMIETGSQVDFYNSEGNPLPDGAHGHVATNSNTANSIKVETNSTVNGRAYTAPGVINPGGIIVDGTSNVVGGQITMPSPVNFKAVSLPVDPEGLDPTTGTDPLNPDAADVPYADLTVNTAAPPLPPGAYGDVVVEAGGILTLVPGGEYTFASLTVRDDSAIQLPNTVLPTSLYIKKTMAMLDGAVVNDSLKPPLLKVFVSQGPVGLKAKKGGVPTKGYYSVYAPDADVKLDEQGQLYGSVIGRSVTLESSSKVTYDMELQNSSGGAVNLQILSHDRY
ncbi:hypothetical protein DYH09_21375 [bacterium CPR1]|nr:hypothetical protein [bacterium CPR1]